MLTRRTLVALSTAALVGGLSCALAQTPAGSPRSWPTASSAFRKAKRDGMPLFLIVIPENAEVSKRRRLVWAEEVVRDGGDEMRADLALCHVFCAPIEQLQRGLPPEYDPAIGELVDSEPWALLIETDQATIRVMDPPELVPLERRASSKRRAEIAEERRQSLERSIRQVILPLPETLVRRGEQFRAAHSRRARGPVIDRIALEAAGKDRAKLLKRLARDAGPRVRSHGVVGGSPCPGPVQCSSCAKRVPALCGRGYIPSVSERFLDVYTR